MVGFFNWKDNVYSKDVLRLEIFGPAEANLGEEVEYSVKYKNNGNFRLEEPKLTFMGPENSLVGLENSVVKILDESQLGGAIYPGEEKTFSFKVRLLGSEGESKVAKATLSYRPKNLKAKYESSTSFTTVIKPIPITFDFDMPTKAGIGKDFSFRINYFSNLNYLLTDLSVQAEYPQGFEFTESTPKSIDKTSWKIPTLNRSEGGRIEIKGKVSGDAGDVKVIRAKLGIWMGGQFIALKEAEKAVELIKPSIYLRQEINGNPQYVALPGDWLHYEIFFKNIGDDELDNLSLISKLEGDAFDFQTIKSDLGQTSSGDNSVVFDWRNIPKLQYLAPVEEGKVDFWVKLKDDLGNVKNPILTDKVFISQVKEEFATKIGSKIEISQKGYYQDEVFGNSGPVPPKSGETTTYTITWQVKNYYSDVKNAKVKAVLPQGVELAGKMFPEDETAKFAFDSQSREIVWSVGDLERGIGISKSPRSVSFQIAFTPSSSQIGQSPQIIGESKITAEDSWTGSVLQSSSRAIDTTLPDDPTITEDMKKVQ